MQDFYNIETKPFPNQTHLVGYAKGEWHIVKTKAYGNTLYVCTHKEGLYERFTQPTLAKVSLELENIARSK